ncbi:chemotaxis protein CheB [Desulfobulbus alkaliphilus]|uniref:chemotaxis protein CheB n=1 Tax=Desulfobulbus alkaliphilus TaxID=869814 RepID=UPI00196396FB|nr:chemotaxis protein CheB [Desulfobulbus alkaliphilus]MBM9537914.1 PAS domain-containing protein [Desulfobulbus alkaliphilus]
MASRKKDKAIPPDPPGDAKTSKGQNSPVNEAAIPEEDKGETADFPIVGIGASAGGLAAFESFFSGMPVDEEPGMAFVLVQHLAPDHKSILTDLIKRYTRMQVFEVEDGMVVRPNCTYIIPPNRDMAYLGGALQLLEPFSPRGRRLPIDFFFRSLAQDQHERAICVVLSGTGSDGTLGLQAIKSEGGMVMAQRPDSTEYDGMPRSAIATGLVDFELLPAEMPAQLIRYAAHAFGKSPKVGTTPMLKSENALRKMFVLLRAHTGHDFSLYKSSTIWRRIERRMALHQIDTVERYIKFSQQTSAEVESLFRDLLIGVTNFFRDPEVFKILEEKIIPQLFADKPAGGTIRAWSPGCASGEEPYSLAILLAERQESLKQNHKVQIFATDIDSQAIARARAGLYPAGIAADITPERLARFFSTESNSGAYRIHKTIRDLLVFSEQNVIRDPPFSKLDFISCRNLMIYMGVELQKKLIPLFYYALNPGGYLLLGISETVGDFADLFAVQDRKAKIYRRKDTLHGTSIIGLGNYLPPLTSLETALPRAAGKMTTQRKPTLRELTEQALLQQIIPAGALVKGSGDILYIHGRTSLFLEPAMGEVGVYNIFKMAREGLRSELTAAMHKVTAGVEFVRSTGLMVKTNGTFTPVNLIVRRVEIDPDAIPETPLYLVILEGAAACDLPTPQQEGTSTPAVPHAAPDIDMRVAALQQELQVKEEYLQTTNEELKSINEEMQSVNEELQSTNEELETSKEELQSINEELTTVNAELQNKVADLTCANNDMNNLLAGTDIGTVFVDFQMRILRFTPAATRIINLIQSDIGRPVGHIVSNLVDYDALLADTQNVLDTLVPKEMEVHTQAGRWYTMRILPYRTLENVIEGAVITFTDITEYKQIKTALSKAHAHLAEAVVATVREPLLVLDTDLRVTMANSAFYSTFQVTPDATQGQLLYELGNRQWDIPELHTLLEKVLTHDAVFNDFTVTHQFETIGWRTLHLNARRIFGEPGRSELILLAIEEHSGNRSQTQNDIKVQ